MYYQIYFVLNLVDRYHKKYSMMDNFGRFGGIYDGSVQLSFLLMDDVDEYEAEFKRFCQHFEASTKKAYFCNFLKMVYH